MIRTTRLIRWLGPWADHHTPTNIRRIELTLRGRQPIRAYEYESTTLEPKGVYVISPGMHFLGADDTRLDRFCRILASAGFIVVAPLLPDMLALSLVPNTYLDLLTAWQYGRDLAALKWLPAPTLFSISFGSLPAIQIAALPDQRKHVGRLVLFGGYSDFITSIQYMLSGVHHGPNGPIQCTPDPLNAPAIYCNLLPHLGFSPEEQRLLRQHWMHLVQRTWGHVKSFKGTTSYATVVKEASQKLPEHLREVFMLGCNITPGACERAVEIMQTGVFSYADPRPHLPNIAAPVVIVHGRDDDVIPWTEADKIKNHLPTTTPCEVLLTGMYGHTGSALPSANELWSETTTLLKVVSRLAE